MAENNSKTQNVRNIRQGNKRFNEQMNHAYWIDRNQARYIDQELLYDSSSWLLEREIPKHGDSKQADDKVNYWRLPADHQNFPQYPNENSNHYNAAGYNIKRTIRDRESGIPPRETTISKRLKTRIIHQQKGVSHGENANKEVHSPRASTEKNEKQCEITHNYPGNCSKSFENAKSAINICGSNSQEIHPHGSNEGLERNHYFHHARSNISNLHSTDTLDKTTGKLDHHETTIYPNSSKLLNRLQDKNISRGDREDFRKAVPAQRPEYKDNSLIQFPVTEHDKVLTGANNSFPIPHQNRLASNTTHSEIHNTVISPVDTGLTKEFNMGKAGKFLNQHSHKDKLSDDSLATSTSTGTKLQTNHIISPASESWIKLISKETQMTHSEKNNHTSGPSNNRVAENMMKLDELRQGFRGTYTKIDFSKPGDLASNNPTEFNRNLQSTTNPLNGHNKANTNPGQSDIWLPETSKGKTHQNTPCRENEPGSKFTDRSMVVETKIKKLLQKSLQSKISRKIFKFGNGTPKSNTGTTKEGGVLATTSSEPTQNETTIYSSDKVPNFSNKCPQSETNKYGSPQKSANKKPDMLQMQRAKNNMQILQSLCKNNPVFLKCLSRQVLRKSQALQQKIQPRSELRLTPPEGIGLKTQQSLYKTGDQVTSASVNNSLLEEPNPNSLINQEGTPNMGRKILPKPPENRVVAHYTGAQQNANSTLSQQTEIFSSQRSINSVQYQPLTITKHYQPTHPRTINTEYQRTLSQTINTEYQPTQSQTINTEYQPTHSLTNTLYQPTELQTNTKEYWPSIKSSAAPHLTKNTNDEQRFNSHYRAMLNTTNHQEMKNRATYQSMIKTTKPTRNAYQNQPVADQAENKLGTDCKKDELTGGMENSTTDKYEQLKHFEQLLKVEYDKYIESKLKAIKTDMDKLENSTQSEQKAKDTDDGECDDVLVIDYFDVDSFIKMETNG
ncbi:uncharacterized protein [Palaemon carinicauda]|uniref:uncharacterized protein n=1 Tax=Palaemon carinicauda TaxID=392227 RepID=UPI0035B58936